MARYAKGLKILGIILAGLVVQALLIGLGSAFYEDLPSDRAVEFTKAYYQMDTSMADQLCEAFVSDDTVLLIEDDRALVAAEARSRGFGFKNMTYLAYGLKTETDYQSETEATVHVTGKRRVAINLIYPYIAILFDLGEAHGIDETITMVKEGDRWKVCQDPAFLFQGA